MTSMEAYVHHLLMALLYSAPLVFPVLYIAWRKKRVAMVLPVVLFMELAAGFLIQSLAYRQQESRALVEADLPVVRGLAGDFSRPLLLSGGYLGKIREGVYEYAVYEFAGESPGEVYRLWLPPVGSHGMAWLSVENSQAQSFEAKARLIIQPDSQVINAATQPAEFFQAYHAELDVAAYGEHTLVLDKTLWSLRLVSPRGDAGQAPWRVNDVMLKE